MPNLRSKTWTTTTPANVADANFWEDHLISDEDAAKAAGAVQSVNNTLPDENGNINIQPSQGGPTVIDSLNSTSATDALSANMGHELNTKKVDIQQGAQNVGKHLVVGNDGNLELQNDAGAIWGNIGGDIKNQSDLQSALAPKVSESLLSDTVGWVGKNRFKIPSSTVSTGIFTVNRNSEDEVTSIVADGTGASGNSQINITIPSDVYGDVTISGCPSGGGINNYDIYVWDVTANARPKKWDGTTQSESDIGNGAEVKLIEGHNNIFVIRIYANKTVSDLPFKPMITDKGITDLTFYTYHKSVEDWYWENNAKTGVHNLLDWKTPTGTDHDVTFTVNSDKTAITPSGTATGGNAYIYSDMSLKAGTYRLLGGISNNCFIQAYLAQSPWTNYGYDYGNGATFTLATDATIRIQCNVSSGKTASGVFYPRIIRAEDTSNAVAPYAMTNAELTEKVQGIIDAANNAADFAAFKTALGNL